jgi:NAD-dependent dihydropyrimidine dehydrogenase PreA subunit
MGWAYGTGEISMAYVITDTCTKDMLCIDTCPSDAIHPRADEAGFEAATQVYVNPELCMDCGACMPVCTTNSIFPAEEVPADKAQFVELNAKYFA